jgi:tetratricopeptide (TPR) repeat protein
MTAVTITVLLLVISSFIGFAIFLQVKEQARLTKLRKVSTLNNQLRQVRRYIDEMPPQYQPKDMRLWLFSRLLAIYDELIVLQPDPTLTRRRANLAEEIEEFKTSKQKRRVKSMNDELLIKEVKRLFESFKSFLIASQLDKSIPSNIAQRYSKLLDFYHYKVSSDYHGHLARKAFLSGQMETAVTLYRKALSQLDPIKDSEEAQTIIAKYEELLKEIEDDLALQRAEEEAIKKSMAEEEDEDLNGEWSKFIEDSEFKMKKRF